MASRPADQPRGPGGERPQGLAGLDTLTGGHVFIGETDLASLSDRELTILRRDRLGFVLAAGAVAAGVPGAATVTVLAASLGLVQKALFFHPWLSFGVAIDLGVLAGALAGWPVSL